MDRLDGASAGLKYCCNCDAARSRASQKIKSRQQLPALSFCSQKRGLALLAETARDVAEHVLDLVAENDQDDDDNHRDQDENKGVLNHTLAFLTIEELTEAQIQIGQHVRFTSFASNSNRTQFHIGCRSNQRQPRQEMAKEI
jgi:hypothetical protein